MAALVPGFETGSARVARGGSGRDRVDGGRGPARARAGGGGRGALPAAHARSSLPRPRAPTPSSCTRWQTSTASSSPSTPTPTAERPPEDRALPGGHRRRGRGRAPASGRGAGALPRGRQDVDLLLTPTIPFVAPRPTRTSPLSARGISLTYPFDCTGWPALALPCGPAEDGLAGLASSSSASRGRTPRPGGRGIPRSRDGWPLETAENKGDAPRTPPAGSPHDAGPGQLRQRCPERVGGCSEKPPRFPLPGRRAGPARVRTHTLVRVVTRARRRSVTGWSRDEQHVPRERPALRRPRR